MYDNDSDTEINLSDSYVTLLSDTVKESRSFREEAKVRDDEARKMLANISNRMDDLCQKIEQQQQAREASNERSTSKQRRSKLIVPNTCRTKTRELYNKLVSKNKIAGFNVNERVTSAVNDEVIEKVVEVVLVTHGGAEKCSWSSAQIREALKTYHRTLKDSSKRSKGPGHKIQCRRDGRVKEKMMRRLNALENVEDWSERIKEKIGAVVGSREYNSSEESDMEQDENGKDCKVFKVKRLPWESHKLRRTKEVLDEVHRGQKNGGVQVVRKRHHNLSNRLMPQNAPSWAVLASSTPRVK